MVDVGARPRVAAGRAAIGVGSVVAQVCTTVARHWLPYFLLSLVLAALGLAVVAKPYIAPEAYRPFSVVVGVLRTVVASVLQAGMTFATARALAGEPFSTMAGIGVGLRRLLPYAGAAILYVLAILFGTILLVVPGLIALASLSVAPALAVVENLGPIASLRRSRALTRGNRWRVLAVQVIVTVVPTLLFLGIGAGSAILHATSPAQVEWQQLLVALVNLVLTPIHFAFPAVLYHQLRRAEGHAGPANLAEVFA